MDRYTYICENNFERMGLIKHLVDNHSHNMSQFSITAITEDIDSQCDFETYPVLVVCAEDGLVHNFDLTQEDGDLGIGLLKGLMYSLIGINPMKPIKLIKKHNIL